MMDKELICSIGLGISAMLLFAAYDATHNFMKVVVSSIEQERDDFHVEGYTIAGIVYTVYAITLWVGPYVNYALGSNTTMIISAVGYVFFVLSFALEEEWVIYTGTVVVGLAAGTLWPAQGHYLIQNSSEKNAGRNAAIFFFFYGFSLLVGNIFVYIPFKGLMYINQTARRTAIYCLVGIAIAGVLAFMALPPSNKSEKDKEYGLIRTIKTNKNILLSTRVLWMSPSFFYAGLQQSFWIGIYSSCVGFTLAFGEYSKELVGLSGIFMSFGVIAGTLAPIVLAGWIRRHSYARRLIVVIGCVVQLCAYLITFINLPDTAVFGNTEDTSIITPSILLALTGSVLLTFGESCLSTQIYSFISDYYRENSAEACALYRFVKSISLAMSFYCCSHLGLHTQTLILGVAALVGTAGFCIADRNTILTDNSDKQGLNPKAISST